MNDNNLNTTNQTVNTEVTPEVKPVNLANTAKIEMAPIQNGVVQSNKVFNGDVVKNTESKKKVNLPLIILLFIAFAFIIGLIVYKINNKDTNVSVASVEGNNLVYTNPKKNDVATFNVNDNLTMQIKITDVIEETNATLVIYNLYVKDSKNVLEDNSVWVDNNKIQIPIKMIGDSLLFVGDSFNDYGGLVLNVFLPNGELHTLDDLDDDIKGFRITDYTVDDNKLSVNFTRIENETNVVYKAETSTLGNISEVGLKEAGTSICSDDINSLDQLMTVSATYIYSLKGNVLLMNNPTIENAVTLSEFIEQNRSTLCQ